jgi:cytochrome P450
MTDNAIEARAQRDHEGVPGLLDLLLEGVDPKTKRKMSTAKLRDNFLTFIVAGHETTALTLAWSRYLLGFDQDVQDRARSEAQSILKDRACTDVENLPYIRMIIDEALRMYPAAGIISCTTQKKGALCGHDILPGDTVMIPNYALGPRLPFRKR